MDIQKLIQSGYTLENIKELITLFQKNLTRYQKIFNQNDQKKILSTLHTFKGGLRLLHFTKLIEKTEHLEVAIKKEGHEQYRIKIANLIEESNKASESVLAEVQNL